jgi:uncharacterized protein (UPF0332 family)
MASYDAELLVAARRLSARREGQRGRLPGARIRRSVSTSYYAIFHFLLDEAGALLIGSQNDLRRRRRTFARMFSHKGMKAGLDKVRGGTADPAVADLLRPRGVASGPVAVPHFAREMAAAFADAQSKRHDADYDLNKDLSEPDARLISDRVEEAIAQWCAASTPVDRDFKHALCMLMLLGGRLRRET